jgi:large subunit ribosomal protein L18
MRSTTRRYEVRKQRVRAGIRENSDRVRLSVFKSGRHLYAQVIDDAKGFTLASASTLDKSLRKEKKSLCNVLVAAEVGKLLGKRAKDAGVTKVVFDKGGYKYHGVVKSLADSAREFLEF